MQGGKRRFPTTKPRLVCLCVGTHTLLITLIDSDGTSKVTAPRATSPKEDSWIWRIRLTGIISDDKAEEWSKAGKYYIPLNEGLLTCCEYS